jgi:phosphate acetyltransferase
MFKKYASPWIEQLIRRCSSELIRVALPEFSDTRVASAVGILKDWGLRLEVHTLMPRAALSNIASDLSACRFIFIDDEPSEIRQSEESALVRSGHLLRLGLVDSVLAGAVHTTAEVIRAAIATVGVKPGLKTVSGAFIMDRASDRRYLFADCGVVIEPSLKQLHDISRASVDTWRELDGSDPVVAFLSFSTHGSAKHPKADMMREAYELFRSEYPDIDCDGEIQFDAAIDANIGKRKSANAKVSGRANIFIFPDLNAANIAYKITERLGGFAAYGPILQGCGKVFSDLSRGANSQDIAASILINHCRSMLSD